jgi:cyanate permease
MGVFLTNIFAACGAPFFGFLFDATGGYMLSFVLFIIALLTSAVLILTVEPPIKMVSGSEFRVSS